MGHPIVHIIRGLPGAGKSTKAKELQMKFGGIIVEPDMLLDELHSYVWTPEKHACAVEVCKEFLTSLTEPAHWGLRPGIIYTDVLPRIEDVEDIIRAGKNPDYRFIVRDLVISKEASINRNVHGVRSVDIEKMAADWQPWDPHVEVPEII